MPSLRGECDKEVYKTAALGRIHYDGRCVICPFLGFIMNPHGDISVRN
jgi:hypothetical protein